MCGLVGVAGNTDMTWMRVFRNLLQFDVVRGFDSTGVGRVSFYNNKMVVDKGLGSPTEYLWPEAHWVNMKGVPHIAWRVLMGHNRAATLGKVLKENAHPFTYGKITGAHNGTLRHYDDLHMSRKYEVDSMSLIHNIAEFGIEHTWSNFHGAAALSWWDEEEETINFIRNKERPLWFALGKDKQVLIWASERWMIEAACIEAGAKLDFIKDEKTGEQEPDIWEMQEHYYHQYKPHNKGITLEVVEQLKPKAGPEPVRKNVVGFPTMGGGRTTTTTTGHSPKTFNWGWGRPLEKAEKGAVDGREFKLYKTFNYNSPLVNGELYIVQGVFLDGDKEMVQIYPETMKEWEAYRDAIKDGDIKDNRYVIKRRPRCRKSVTNASKVSIYCTASSSIELVEGKDIFLGSIYMNRNNKITSDKEEAKEDLHYAGGRCGFCDTDLTVDDLYSFTLYGNAVICEECEKNEPMVSQTFGTYVN